MEACLRSTVGCRTDWTIGDLLIAQHLGVAGAAAHLAGPAIEFDNMLLAVVDQCKPLICLHNTVEP